MAAPTNNMILYSSLSCEFSCANALAALTAVKTYNSMKSRGLSFSGSTTCDAIRVRIAKNANPAIS